MTFMDGEMARFLERRVENPDGHWLWVGYLQASGYGVFYRRMVGQVLAHRFSYEMFVGPCDGKVIDHLCRVRSCVNPAHLEAVSIATNVMRGEGICARRARQTHCKHGHEFTDWNTYRPPSGGR